MEKVVVIEGPKKIGFRNYEDKALAPHEVKLKTLYSGISAGTQLTLYRGKNPFNTKRFDRNIRLFEKEESHDLLYPNVGAWGYEEVGEIVAIGKDVSKVKAGQIVYGTWGHRSSNIVSEEFAINHLLPEGVNPIVGIYSQMGAIALNAILDADIHVGETVIVFGQGVPGQIVARLAKLSGAIVIVVDMDDWRLKKSKEFGVDYVFNPSKTDVGLEVKKITGQGADKCIEISGSSYALQEAIRSTVYNGRVVCSGFIVGEAKGLFLGEEFHHNRISIVCSQIDGVTPSVSNAWNRLRMEKTIMRLEAEKKLNLNSLITNVIPFDEVAKAYNLLDTTRDCLQVVLKF